MSRLFRSLLAAFAVTAGIATARGAAAQVPTRVVDRDVVLPANVAELRLDVRLGLSHRAAGDIAIVAPSLSYGFSDKFTLSILHTRENYVGDGGSFCVGSDCGSHHYGQVAIDGKYRIYSKDKASIAIDGAVEGYAFDPFVFGIRGGIAGKVRVSDDFALLFNPTLFLGITNRSSLADSLVLPLRFQFKVDDHFAPFVDTGLYFDGFEGGRNGRIDFYGRPRGAWRLPLGAGFIYAANTTVDLGLRFAFLGVLNGYNGYGSFDGRELVGSLALHF